MRTRSNNLDSSQISAISRLFSARVIKELSKYGQSPLFTRLAEEAELFDNIECQTPISEVFENAFSILQLKDNRHEYIYKAALTHKVLLGTHSLKTASMINEFRVGTSKADTVILNGTGTVYEIKSERDTLKRLVKQITAYRDVFAKVNVITGENHLDAVKGAVHKDVGIMLLSNRFKISTIREAIDLPERTKSLSILEAVQSQEAQKILIDLGHTLPDVPNTRMHSALAEIYRSLPSKDVHVSMVKILKKTRSLIPLEDFVDQLPKSLIAAAFSTKIRKMDRNTLVRSMKTPISEAKLWN